jgi:hypothetical protein
MSRIENFRIDPKQDITDKPLFVPNSILDTLKRNLEQAAYPNSKLNEPINNFKLFYPDLKKDTRAQELYVSNYDDKVMNYNSPDSENVKLPSKQPIYKMSHENTAKFLNSKPITKFAKPLQNAGTNKLDYLIFTKLNESTFNFKRFGQPIHDVYVDNPLYYGDISDETRSQNDNYFDNIADKNLYLINGVLEDMNLLQNNYLTKTAYSSSEYDEIDANIDSRNIKNIQKTY